MIQETTRTQSDIDPLNVRCVMKKIWKVLFVAAALISAAFVTSMTVCAYETVFRYPAGSGYLLQVDYDAAEKTIYVSGIGESEDMYDNDALNFWVNHKETPWYKYRNVVTKVRFRRGVKVIYPGYFKGFSKLTEVYLPETVQTIYTEVFDDCPKLGKVYYEGTEDDKNLLTNGDGEVYGVYDQTLYTRRNDISFWKCLEKDSSGYRNYSLLDSVLTLNGTRYSVLQVMLFSEYEMGHIDGRTNGDAWEFDLNQDGYYDISLKIKRGSDGELLNSATLKTLETASIDKWVFDSEDEFRDMCLDNRQYFSRFITIYLFEYVDISEECSFTLKNVKDYTYTGSQIKPATILKYGSKVLTKGTNYKICSYRYNVNVGTARITALGLGKYTGKITTTFRIVPKSVTPAVTVKEHAVYNGGYVKPTVEVKADGKVIPASGYTVTVASGGKIVGPSKAKIRLKGNYTGTALVSYNVNPQPTTISSLTGGTGSMVIKWYVVTSQTTGYEIQIAKDKAFKNILKQRRIGKSTIGRLNQTELPASTLCYVRVRTYKIRNNVKYFSAWSPVRSAKTK